MTFPQTTVVPLGAGGIRIRVPGCCALGSTATLDGPAVIAVVLLSPLPVAALLASRPPRFLVQKITDGATRTVESLLRPVEVGAQDLR